MKIKTVVIVMLLIFLGLSITCTKNVDNEKMLADLFKNNKDITILVTDSGLGGLSVAADVAARLPESGVFEKTNIVFFNSLFHNKSGYNSLEKEKEKVRIFDTALEAMKEKYQPDLLLIACNTLSVLYDQTSFAKHANFPVVGIVKTGVNLIKKQFEQAPSSTVIIFATKTTIGAETHKNMLIKDGIPAEQIVGQACHRLAGRIEAGPNSEETVGLINQYVHEALENIQPGTPLFVSLNCTHYGYSIDQFKNAFAKAGYPEITIIDPNPQMADFLFENNKLHRFPQTHVKVEVVSKVEINEKKKNSLDPLIRSVSPLTADALQNYRHDAELFDAKFDTTLIGK